MNQLRYAAYAFAACVGFAMLLAVSYAAEVSQCETRWHQSGMLWRFESPGGCLVRLDSGRWVPASAVRVEVAR